MPNFESQLIIEHDSTDKRGTYSLIRSIDKSVKDLHDDLYSFRSDFTARIAFLERMHEKHSQEIAELKQDTAILKNDVAELKQEVKELHHDVSDIKGDIKAIAAGFGAAQNRFNWGLIILGLFVALIQLLK